jgi:cytochrome P450/nitrite reductase/ring-hydroxylating ferredoxin subunit
MKRIAKSSDLAGPGPHALSDGQFDLVAVRAARGLKVYEGRCPHQGALLGEGELDGATLVCRNHRWRFDVETGKREGGPQCLRACPAEEVEGEIRVDTSALGTIERAKAKRTIKDLRGPSTLPLIGSAHLLEPDTLHLQLERWSREYGSPFVYRFGSKDVVVFADIDAMMPVLKARPETFRRSSNLEPIFKELGVAGVFSAEGAAWRPQRKLSMEALSHKHLRGFYPTLATVAERCRKRWARKAEAGETLDLPEELKRFTVDVTTQLVFGYDINTLEQEGDVIQRKLELMFPAFNRRLFSVVPWWRIIRMPQDRKVDRTVAELRQWLAGLVADARKRANPEPANFLEAMIAARDEEGRPFEDEVIYGNAMTMLLAGEDTTAYSLAWAVHHLIDAPSDVDALRKELDAALGRAKVPPDIEVTNKLAYAGAVANEAMRLRPVAPIFFLDALEDTIVGDVAIPKDSSVVLLIRPPALDAENFADPDVFRPSRWVAPSGAHDAGAHQPFGSGPRICPGRTLALLEMKLVLAMLYRSFDVERVGAASDVKEAFSFTMMPRGLNVRMKFRR